MLRRLAFSCALAIGASAAMADNDPSGRSDEQPWKFTPGVYTLSGGGLPRATALDVSRRRSGSFGNAWIGWYGQDAGGPTQWRAGWDRFLDAGALRIQPSVQVASGGFRGGSLYAEAGDTWF